MSKTEITRETVARVAALARLRLADDEASRMRAELAAIVGHVERLAELDTEGLAETTHAAELATTLRDDAPSESLPRELALANAPEPIAGGFGVPKVIE